MLKTTFKVTTQYLILTFYLLCIVTVNKSYILDSFKFPKLVELLPLACEAPVFPAELPPATADPALGAAAPIAPGGSANELVLGRPLPLIFVKTNAGAGGTPYKEPGRHRLNLNYYYHKIRYKLNYTHSVLYR